MMVRIKEGIIITFASIVIPSFSFSTHACDNHGSMGFRDFGHMAQLGQTHPLMQRPSSAFRSAGLTLKHEKTIIYRLHIKMCIYALPPATIFY
jgi:hypothetical protein